MKYAHCEHGYPQDAFGNCPICNYGGGRKLRPAVTCTGLQHAEAEYFEMHRSCHSNRPPPMPQGVPGVCEGCGAVAWELLDGLSPLCLGCAPRDYSRGDVEDEES